ncbi:MAG: SGNH/GDSL hydrolase family protein [Alicyclobacillaceae bacterium]|nr:SGNH/GDSL hydrolase family protein [Alicyclobacillaceae bacterium]
MPQSDPPGPRLRAGQAALAALTALTALTLWTLSGTPTPARAAAAASAGAAANAAAGDAGAAANAAAGDGVARDGVAAGNPGHAGNAGAPAGAAAAANTGAAEVLTVMVAGGSSARGWNDPNHNSYLHRALQQYAAATGAQLVYDDHSIPGAAITSVTADTWARWLAADHPQVVVISWGLLNDVHRRTPLADFSEAFRDEIEQALAQRAAVLVVTPPVVTASVTSLKDAFDKYLTAEYQVVTSLHNPNVYWFDIHMQTINYIQGRGLDVAQFCANTWHPNETGHGLAGDLLYQDLISAFGPGPIRYRSSPALLQTRNPARQPSRQSGDAGTNRSPQKRATASGPARASGSGAPDGAGNDQHTGASKRPGTSKGLAISDRVGASATNRVLTKAAGRWTAHDVADKTTSTPAAPTRSDSRSAHSASAPEAAKSAKAAGQRAIDRPQSGRIKQVKHVRPAEQAKLAAAGRQGSPVKSAKQKGLQAPGQQVKTTGNARHGEQA